ncbi:MAG TPA: hypothetical protein VF546_08150 [Pyrinomonadaceae bacterium]
MLSESSADEAAIRILVNGILGRETEEVPNLPLRARGWPFAIRVLPTVLKYLHYRTDADTLVVVVDSDDAPLHEPSHDEPGGSYSDCRLCQLRTVVASELKKLRPTGRNPLKTALGLAVPAIEAWYQCGLDPHVNEATWARRLQSEPITYTRRTLKQSVYGTERPTIQIEEACAIKAATRLAHDFSMIEQLFPNGFGSLARDIRGW